MNLQDKAVDIKGKKYILVKDRVLAFNEMYPTGSIVTKILSPLDSQNIVVVATIRVPMVRGAAEATGNIMVDREYFGDRVFTGHSQATIGEGYINKTAALENAETSAVGRALAMMGIGVIDSIASVDEINKAEGSRKPKTRTDKGFVVQPEGRNAEQDNINPPF